MTISIDSGLPTTGRTASTFVTKRYDYSQVFRNKSPNKPNEVVLTDINADIDRPLLAKIGCTEVANVYKNSGISPQHQAASTRGKRLFYSLLGITKKTDDSDPTYDVRSPLKVHLVVERIDDPLVTEAMVAAWIGEMLGLLQDESTGLLIDEQSRGALVPATI
jgi:hypothetical protein